MRANKIVHVNTLVDELWSEAPPRTALSSLRTHIYNLRGIVRETGYPGISDGLITEPSGYTLRVDPEWIDSRVFAKLVAQGKALLQGQRFDEASYCLGRALELWRGQQPMANVDTGPVLTRHAVQLQEERLNALQLRIEADMNLGRHRELIGELKDLIAADPYNEWFHARLIVALNQAGRRREALEIFHDLRTQLNTELGVEPSGDVQREHMAVLSGAE